jgi:hypothetical protein
MELQFSTRATRVQANLGKEQLKKLVDNLGKFVRKVLELSFSWKLEQLEKRFGGINFKRRPNCLRLNIT